MYRMIMKHIINFMWNYELINEKIPRKFSYYFIILKFETISYRVNFKLIKEYIYIQSLAMYIRLLCLMLAKRIDYALRRKIVSLADKIAKCKVEIPGVQIIYDSQ